MQSVQRARLGEGKAHGERRDHVAHLNESDIVTPVAPGIVEIIRDGIGVLGVFPIITEVVEEGVERKNFEGEVGEFHCFSLSLLPMI